MARPLARRIKSARDHKGAASIVKKTLQQSEREPEAERRLQALLDAIEDFDGDNEEEGSDDSTEELDGEFRRRWSDEA